MTSARWETHQDDSRIVDVSYEGKPTKVLIFGDHDPALSVSHLHQLLVNGPLLKFADCQDIVSG
jgi:hypothetical protein